MFQRISLALCLAVISIGVTPAAEPKPPLKILFLGDNGHHKPAERFAQLEPVLKTRGIELTFSDKVESLAAKTLAAYDGLIIYANTTKISPDQERALLDFVEGGKGFIPLHCASYCFLDSPKYIDLVGAQFLRHGTGTFRTEIALPDHPIMKGFPGFESWDETYVHTKHNEKDRAVLEYRADGKGKEPWSWVRMQGKGRVFYTAWGHDERTWRHPEFQNLVERGIRWATGNDPSLSAPSSLVEAPFPVPKTTTPRKDVAPFEYVDVGKKIPNYQARGGLGEAFSEMQKPLAPAESLKHLITPVGFHAELFVSEEELGGKPICMTWDERGRLWAALTLDYPNELQPRGRGRDKIVICEDTDDDWRADKITVFADKLSIPTSMIHSRGGLIVFDGTQTIFLKDTNGDDVADERTSLFGNWSQGDTHGGPSNMQYGLDNWIWAMQGYNQSRLKVGNETHEFRQGFLRFRPDASQLEFIRSTNNNTWGLGISEEGIIFGSTANHNPSVYMPIPNRYYESVRGWTSSLTLGTIADTHLFKAATDKVRQVDQHGGYTAAAGHSLYTARRYPREYWNRVAFVCEPTGHLVGTFVLSRDGSDFHSTNPFNLVASDDEWTAPIMAEVGPDGNVWVLDWYNYIVQHNPTPAGFLPGKGAAYETDLRDKKHGRVYRIVYDGDGGRGGEGERGRQGDKESMSLAGASPQKLVETLKNKNLFWRRHAQRLLVERGIKDVVPALIEAAKDPSVDEIGLNAGVIHSLWTLHGLGALDGENGDATAAVVAALSHKSAGVRRNAVQVVPPKGHDAQVVGRLQDADPQVRLMALLSLADRTPSQETGVAVVDVFGDSRNAADRWIADAATSAAARNSKHFLKALSSKTNPGTRLLATATIVAEHYARGAPANSVGDIVSALVSADPQAADAIIRGLAKGWPSKQPLKLTEQLEENLEKLLARLPEERRGVLVSLATSWGSSRFEKYAAEARKSLLAQVQNEAARTDVRLAAARELAADKGADKALVQLLLDQITPRTPSDLSAGLLQSLQTTSVPEGGTLILARLSGLTPAARSAGFGVLLSRPEWTRSLLDAAEKGELRLGELSLDQKQALATHPDSNLRKRAQELLKKGGALPSPDRQKVFEELVSVVKEKGDAAAGKEVFKKQCAKCHVHSGEGSRIGPDLTGMAVHTKEHLLGDILDPSRNVEGNFRVYTVVTEEGQVVTGLLASESKTAIELFDAEGKKQSILLSDVEKIVPSPKSLMPEGFEKQVSRQEIINLLEFLTKRGKFLPLPLDKVATVVSTKGMFYSEEAQAERLVFDDWSPKTFEGVPYHLVDPRGDKLPNVVLLHGPEGAIPPKMPRSVSLVCNTPAKAIHLLSGVSGWGFPLGEKNSVSLIVRLAYDDGTTEDHPLKNGEHFADYIRRVDVPASKFAYNLQGRQIRSLSVIPQKPLKIERIDLVKGSDRTAPVVMAVTVETRE